MPAISISLFLFCRLLVGLFFNCLHRLLYSPAGANGKKSPVPQWGDHQHQFLKYCIIY